MQLDYSSTTIEFKNKVFGHLKNNFKGSKSLKELESIYIFNCDNIDKIFNDNNFIDLDLYCMFNTLNMVLFDRYKRKIGNED